MSDFRLNKAQTNWLKKLLKDDVLKDFHDAKIWYDFNIGLDIHKLYIEEEYWEKFRINTKIQEILKEGVYDRIQRAILNSVRQYCINKSRIHKINNIPSKLKFEDE